VSCPAGLLLLMLPPPLPLLCCLLSTVAACKRRPLLFNLVTLVSTFGSLSFFALLIGILRVAADISAVLILILI